MEAGGWYTTKECDQAKDFDTCMLHFALIAGDDYWIDRIAHSSQRRMFHLINLRLSDLGELEGNIYGWEYARAIYYHMNLPEHMHDCPAELLWKVFQALDTHVRRLRDRCHPVRSQSQIANRKSQIQTEIPF